MKPNLFVYLSGPITAAHGFTVAENVESACVVYWKLLRLGIPAFCPHLSAGFPAAFDVPYEAWIAYDFAVIDRCTHLLMLPRWQSSPGARRERQYAEEHGVPIVESTEELLESLGVLV